MRRVGWGWRRRKKAAVGANCRSVRTKKAGRRRLDSEQGGLLLGSIRSSRRSGFSRFGLSSRCSRSGSSSVSGRCSRCGGRCVSSRCRGGSRSGRRGRCGSSGCRGRSRSFFLFAASGQSQSNEGGNEERVFHFQHSYHKKNNNETTTANQQLIQRGNKRSVDRF